jgi:hypothetical protein
MKHRSEKSEKTENRGQRIEDGAVLSDLCSLISAL